MTAVSYVNDGTPGIRRRRRGKKFVYLSPRGRELNGSVAQRIDALAIPPAWTDAKPSARCVHASMPTCACQH